MDPATDRDWVAAPVTPATVVETSRVPAAAWELL